jgi:hypothetical protein
MGFPSVGHEGLFRNHSDEVYRFFETMHSDKYKVYNLCRYIKKRKKNKKKILIQTETMHSDLYKVYNLCRYTKKKKKKKNKNNNNTKSKRMHSDKYKVYSVTSADIYTHMCPHTATTYCPHTVAYVSTYCNICVYFETSADIYVCPHTAVYVFSHCCTYVLILLYMCPHTFSYCYICVLILLYMCSHTAIYVSSYCYICVLILLYMCPHTAMYVSRCELAVALLPDANRQVPAWRSRLVTQLRMRLSL